MSTITLFIGDKNLSSWSLRAWLALKAFGIPFGEKMIRLDRPESRAALLAHSPSGLVPCLVDGNIVVWESLAIAEYLAESFPDRQLWPADKAARAHARAVAAEMHSGFTALRTVWPMNFSRRDLRLPAVGALERDIERIAAIWCEARENFGAEGGPFLYGKFSVADAFYAPVVSRFATYGPLHLPEAAAAYMEAVLALPAMREWGDGAAAEAAGR